MPIAFQYKTCAPEHQNPETMKESFFSRAFHLYYDGFRSMTLGRTLWAVIIVKLIIIFAILKVFFFPSFIGEHAEEGEEAEFVAGEMLERGTPNL